MSAVKSIETVIFAAALAAAVPSSLLAMDHPVPGVGNNARYATDAYPGFDTEKETVSPERKEPRWFSFRSSSARS